MKFFKSSKKKVQNGFKITEADRIWVEDEFEWLIESFGYPSSASVQLGFNKKDFPITFSQKELKSENVLEDLRNILYLNSVKIDCEYHTDLRDTYEIPYGSDEGVFESELEIISDKSYRIHIAKSLDKRPKKLLSCLIFDCIRIWLNWNKVEPFEDELFEKLFLHLAAIYFRLGAIILIGLKDVGQVNDGTWKTSWSSISIMPAEVMTFGLALHSSLIGVSSPKWTADLPHETRRLFEGAMEYIEDNPSSLVDEVELRSRDLFFQGWEAYTQGNYEKSLDFYKNLLAISKNTNLKADAENNLGYSLMRMQRFEESIIHFKQALELDPNFGYAYDNLGYALIQIGDLDEGKVQLEKALTIENNDEAYTLRNLALYYQAKGDVQTAERKFLKALDVKKEPVDLLEYHYGNFLLEQGRTQEGLDYLNQACRKNEKEAIDRLKELNNVSQ